MQVVTFEDRVVEKEISAELRQDPPFDIDALRNLSWLILRGWSKRLRIRTLSDFKYMSGLENLTVEGLCGVAFSPLFQLHRLSHLDIAKTDLSDLSGVKCLNDLEYLNVPWNFIEDLSPLLELPNLRFLEIYGNPLTPESYYEVLPRLEERVRAVMCDNEKTWKLQRRMWEEGHRACYGKKGHYRLIVPELCCRLNEVFEVRIEPDELEAELAREGADIEEIADRRRDKPYRRAEHTETGDAEAARGWIEEAELDARLEEALRGVVDRLDGVAFVREGEAVFDHMQGQLYYWQPYPKPEGGRPQIPAWYRAQKSALSYLLEEDEDALVMLAAQDLPEALDGAPVALRPVGVRGIPAKKALTDRWAFFPIAYAGKDANLALGIRLGDPDDRQVYLADLDRALSWEFDPFEVVAFEDIAALFDAIDKVVPASQIDGPIAELGDEPPPVATTFDLSEHRTAMTADDACEHLADCELDEALAESLSSLVDAFAEAEFVCEDDALINYWEVSNQAQFPTWYRRLRKALALPVVAGTHPNQARIEFSHRRLRGESYVLSPPVVHLKSMRKKLIDEAGALPVGWEAHRLLVIRRDSDDPTIYEFDPSVYLPEEAFQPFDSPVFSGPAQMLDAIAVVSTTVLDEKLRRTR